MKILKITVVQVAHSADTVILHTDLPEATWPYKPAEGTLSMVAARGEGVAYCQQFFPGIHITVVP